MQLTRVRNVTLCSIFFAAVTSTIAPAASGRMAIQSHPDLGGKCIDVTNAQFSQGMRLQMWACASIVWGQPNTEVTLGIVRKSGRSDIRVKLGDSATPGPLAQVFTYDEASQQIKIGSLCVESWGRGDPQDAVGLGACEGKENQRWKMATRGDFYQITGVNGLCLESRSGAKENGAALDLMNCEANRTQQLWSVKTSTRGVLGIHWRKPTEEESSSLALAPGIGVTVMKVVAGGPAEKSELAAGDVIVTIDGQVLQTPVIAPRPSSAGAPGCSRYIPSAGLTVDVPCEAYLVQEAEAKREAQEEAGAKRLSSPASAQERWAAIDPNNEASASVVWATTKDQARHLAIDACRKVSQTCASGPTDTKEMNDMFAVMCCTQPTVSCAVAVANSKDEALAAVKMRFSDAGYTQCTLKNYFKAGNGEKS
jgi:hypothetical protein